MKEHECFKCGKKFAQRGNLLIHVRAVHERRRDWGCPRCAKTFTQAHMLKKHMLEKHAVPVCWACSVCGASFEGARSLRCHCVKEHSTVEMTRAAGHGAEPLTFDAEESELRVAKASSDYAEEMPPGMEDERLGDFRIEQCWCGWTFETKGQLEKHNCEVHRSSTSSGAKQGALQK